jgi:hypothetical protein
MQINTVPTLTHVNKKTTFFQFSKRTVASSGLLEKLRFVQWRVSETVQKKTESVNVIRLAALLAALPRMGICAFNFSHNQLAKKFGELYQMPAPSRKSVLTWEHKLSEIGYLKIPQHNASKAKTRVFTKEFWELSRHGMPPLSYTSVPVTRWDTYGDLQATPKDPNVSKKFETEKRAIDIDNKEQRGSRAESQIKKFDRPPRYERAQPKKLDKFENSVMFWFFKQKTLSSYREGVILFAKFLQICKTDPYCRQLQKNWADCRDGSRPGLARNLIEFLRGLSDGAADEPEPLPPLQLAGIGDLPGDEPHAKEDPQIKALLATLLFEKPYRGRHPAIVKKYHSLDDSDRDKMLLQIMDGRLPKV